MVGLEVAVYNFASCHSGGVISPPKKPSQNACSTLFGDSYITTFHNLVTRRKRQHWDKHRGYQTKTNDNTTTRSTDTQRHSYIIQWYSGQQGNERIPQSHRGRLRNESTLEIRRIQTPFTRERDGQSIRLRTSSTGLKRGCKDLNADRNRVRLAIPSMN